MRGASSLGCSVYSVLSCYMIHDWFPPKYIFPLFAPCFDKSPDELSVISSPLFDIAKDNKFADIFVMPKTENTNYGMLQISIKPEEI